MKILVLTSTYSRSKNDTEPKFVDNLSQYLSNGNTVHVLAPHAPNIPTKETLDGIPIFRFRYFVEPWQTLTYDGGILPNLKQNPFRLFQVPLFLLCQWLYTIRLLRNHHYDVVHAHWIIPQGLVAILARPFAKRRPALVLTSHGGDMFALKGSIFSSLKAWIARRADHLTVVSSAMKHKATLLGLEDDTVSVIPMGVDSQGTFTPPAADKARDGLIFVGRLVEKKGIEYLIRALPTIIAKYPEQRLVIIGDGPLRQHLEELCCSLEVAHAVNFEGALTNHAIPPYLQRAAIAIIPSVVTQSGDQEGTPVAIMETLACGVATVVSDYPGARDIIQDGDNGFLVPPKAPEQIAEKVFFLLENSTTRATLGKNGRKSIEDNYDWRIISKAFQSIFDQLVA
ncbi:MAG: glycosyltransferase involved in cell wall biosynthesis [Desulforhopalus sp.]|jgi:glycosyltransferase involved in cell wall biosynthesis